VTWPLLFDQLFGQLAVMEPRSTRRLPADGGYIAQVKWDGIRMLAFIGGGRVRLQNRQGRDRTAVYPEAAALAGMFGGEPLILDGEFVLFTAGRPSFTRLLRREQVGVAGAATALHRWGPVTYCIFDLLYAGGEDLRPAPWHERDRRLQALRAALVPDAEAAPGSTPGPVVTASRVSAPACQVHFVESFRDLNGLWQRTRELGLEGIVLKRTDAAYWPGKRHRAWWKLKHRQRQRAWVIGFLARGPLVTSLLLAVREADQLRYIGRVSSGLNRELGRLLHGWLAAERVSRPPATVPRNLEKQAAWVRPRLMVEVEYLEWTPAGRLRHPVLVGFPAPSPESPPER